MTITTTSTTINKTINMNSITSSNQQQPISNSNSKVPIKIKSTLNSSINHQSSSSSTNKLQISYPKLNQQNQNHRRSKSDHHYTQTESDQIRSQILQSRRKNSIVQSTNGRVSIMKHLTQPPPPPSQTLLKQTKSTNNLRTNNNNNNNSSSSSLPTRRLHPILLQQQQSSSTTQLRPRPSLPSNITTTNNSIHQSKSIQHSKSIHSIRTQPPSTPNTPDTPSLPSPRPLRIRKIHRTNNPNNPIPKLTALQQRDQSLPDHLPTRNTNLTKDHSITRSTTSSGSRDSILSDHSSSTPTTPRTATSDYSLKSDVLESIQPLPTPLNAQFQCASHPYQTTYSQSQSHSSKSNSTTIHHQEPYLTKSSATHQEPYSTKSSTIHQEPYSAKSSTTHQEPYSTKSSAIHQEPYLTKSSTIHQEPYSAKSSTTHQEPYSAKSSTTHQEPYSAKSSTTHQEPYSAKSSTTHQEPYSAKSSTTHQEPYSAKSSAIHQESYLTKSSTIHQESNSLSRSTRTLHTPHQTTPPNHISVLLRIRRPINLPKPGQSHSLNLLNPTTVEVTNTVSGPKSHFSFDHIFGPETDSQSEIYERLLQTNDLIKGFLNGFNATLIAYGQTGTGKSYTMGTGPSSGPRAGIIPRALEEIFNLIDHPSHDDEPDWILEHANVKVAFLEVYNDELGDLLIPSPNHPITGRRTPTTTSSANSRIQSPSPHPIPNIQIREEKGGGISWTGLREVSVKSSFEALDQLQIGLGRRVTNATKMNAQSSRSHAIFCLMLDQQLKNRNDASVMRRKSKFNFVDLAGSERVRKTKAEVGGERFKEGIAINSGLHALGNVISALSSSSNSSSAHHHHHHHHIPYRESKLTRLLQDSLGGNSNTMMIACVSPEQSNVGESMSTMRYASRAREIKNKLSQNEEKVNLSAAAGLSTVERNELNQLRAKCETQQIQFDQAIKPIIEEYEKTLRVMEIEMSETQEKLRDAMVEIDELKKELVMGLTRAKLMMGSDGDGDGRSDCGSGLDFLLDRKDEDEDDLI